MMYAVIEPFLHVMKHFLRGVYLFLFLSLCLLLVTLSSQVLFRCDVSLSDVQETRPKLLQLTARDAYQGSVEPVEAQQNDCVYHRS